MHMVDGMYTSSSRTIWIYTEVLVAIALILFAIAPVSADVIMPINPTKVYFEKNGTPVNEPVTFTVNCYGNHPSGSPPSQSKPSASECVFRFSGTCPSYGCTVFERYYNTETMHINSCELEGELNGEHFIIRNFSNTPKPNCTSLHQNNSLFQQINSRWDKCLSSFTGNSTTKEGQDEYIARYTFCDQQYTDELTRNNLITSNHHGLADELCTLRFAIPPERYEPIPTPSHTPMMSPHSYSYLPLPVYVVLVSIILAGGLAMMIRNEKTR